MAYEINQPTPEIAAFHQRWAKNRDFVNGEDAVKAKGRVYLPPVRPDDTPAEYRAHLERTSFFPAVNKIAMGLVGLIHRKRAQLNTSSALVQTLAEAISPNGQSLDDLSEEVTRETLITNFTGLLADHPDRAKFAGRELNAANFLRQGFRPTISVYVAESILEATYGLVGNARSLVRVRLLEADGARVRELLINERGEYEVRIHTAQDGQFSDAPVVAIPRIDGEPLREIPFVIVSLSDKPTPQPSILQHSVDLNLNHYRVEGLYTSALFFTAGPTIVVKGFVAKTNEQGQAVEPIWDLSPGSVWLFPEPSVEVDFLQFDPKGAELITSKLLDIKDALSTIGHSILAPEKPAPEAAETQMLRRAAENATLAAFTRTVSRKVEKALKFFAAWADPAASDLTYSLNTDFLPQKMSPQEIQALLACVMANTMSWETFFLALRDGEVVSPALTPEEERAKIETDLADRPPVEA